MIGASQSFFCVCVFFKSKFLVFLLCFYFLKFYLHAVLFRPADAKTGKICSWAHTLIYFSIIMFLNFDVTVCVMTSHWAMLVISEDLFLSSYLPLFQYYHVPQLWCDCVCNDITLSNVGYAMISGGTQVPGVWAWRPTDLAQRLWWVDSGQFMLLSAKGHGKNGVGIAQLVECLTKKPGAIPTWLRVPGSARDFSPRVGFLCRYPYGVCRTPVCNRMHQHLCAC